MGKAHLKNAARGTVKAQQSSHVKSFKLVNKLKCIYTNADQLRNKFSEFQIRIRDQKPMIIGVTEVKAKNSKTKPSPSEYKMEWSTEYNMFHANLENNEGRGLIMYVHNSLQASELKMVTNFDENLFVKININKNENALVGLIYRSPSNNNVEQHEKLRSLIAEASNLQYTHQLIMGDFNYPQINWEIMSAENDKSEEQKFVECVEDNFLFQAVNKPTRWRGTDNPTILDLILTGNDKNIEDLEYQSPLGKSDHCVLIFNLVCRTLLNENMNPKRRYNKGDYEGIRNDLNNFDWKAYLNADQNNVDETWNKFQEKMKILEEKHIPLSKPRNKKNSIPLERDVTEVIKEKNRLNKKFIETKDEEVRKKYNKVRNKAGKLVKRARKNYEKNLAKEAKANPKKVWKYINLKSKVKEGIGELCKDVNDPKSTKTNNDREKANILADFFSSVFTKEPEDGVPELPAKHLQHDWKDLEITENTVGKLLKGLKQDKSPGIDNLHPQFLKELHNELTTPLTIIFNKSLNTKTIPKDWKKARISAIHKKGSKSQANNYRPVSLTSIACKTMEKIIRNHITEHLNSNDLFTDKQFGFMAGRSTSLQLINVLEEWTEAIDSSKTIDCLYMDYRKAFDTVPHKRLLKKLEAYGIGQNMIDWLQDYLNERLQQVSVNGQNSEWHRVTSGVPQGSVIGPLMFVLYINDLPDKIESPIYLFADDTKIFKIINTQEDQKALQRDLVKLQTWTETWLLQLHPEKCKYLHIGKNLPWEEWKYDLGGTVVESSEEEKDIGVTIDRNLTFNKHISQKVKKANSMTAMLRRIFQHLDEKTFIPLYKTLVRTHIEYAHSAWAPFRAKDVDMIEAVQRRATKIIPGFANLTYEERLRKLKLPTLTYRRWRGDMIEVYKIIHGIYDKKANKVLKLNNEVVDRSSTRGNPFKLFTQRPRLDVRKYSFSVRVAKAWNSLPEKVVTAKSVDSFKNRLDKQWKDQDILYCYKAELKTGSHRVLGTQEESDEEDPEGTCVGNPPK